MIGLRASNEGGRVLQWKFIVAPLTLATAIVAVSTTPAPAEAISYFGGPDTSKANLTNSNVARDLFLATLDSYGVEDLEALGGQKNPTLAFGTTGLTATTGFSEGVQTLALYAVSGQRFLYDSGTAHDRLEFSEPVTAFGSYVTQGGDGSPNPPTSAPPNTLTFRLENTILETSKEVIITDLGPGWPFFNVIFVGVTDAEPFNRVTLIESYDNDGLLWDDLIAGQIKPIKTPILGDFNDDGLVDGADLEIWTANFGTLGNAPYTLGDANGDGATDGADFLIWQQHFPAGSDEPPAPAASIPEPSSWTLLLAAIGCAGRRRRAQA